MNEKAEFPHCTHIFLSCFGNALWNRSDLDLHYINNRKHSNNIIFFKQKENKKGKLFLILFGVYLLVSLGVCGIMLSNFTLDTK